MTEIIGHVRELFRYPIKSMAGQALNTSEVGWHGLAGDRRFAFRRLDSHDGMPWLTASHLRRLVLYQPCGPSESGAPTQVETPDGTLVDLWSDDLRKDVSEQFGSQVELMHLRQGIFDDASISIITRGTLKALEKETELVLDVRRFRPNIVIETISGAALEEDSWTGKTLVFGDMAGTPAISVTTRDVRCSMINLDPDTAESDPEILKAAVRMNDNNAGVYGTVTRIGNIAVGDPVFLRDA